MKYVACIQWQSYFLNPSFALLSTPSSSLKHASLFSFLRLLEEGKVAEADKRKDEVEEKQRERRKEMAKRGEEHIPRFFRWDALLWPLLGGQFNISPHQQHVNSSALLYTHSAWSTFHHLIVATQNLTN